MTESEAMVRRIMGNEGVFYRQEQRGAPDLSDEEKKTILNKLYSSNPRLFISRYFKYMKPEDCGLFDASDYDVTYYTQQIIERGGKEPEENKDTTQMRNLRYAELERLKRESDYFSYAKMREREPLLFDKMIGRFLPEEEQVFLRPTIENDSLSGMLMQFEESQIVSDRRKMQIEENAFGFQGQDEDVPNGVLRFEKMALHAECRRSPEEEVEEEIEAEMESLKIQPEPSSSKVDELEIDTDIEDEQGKEQLRNEFVDYMEQQFLGEKDAEFFDYEALYNKKYSKELEKIRDQDIEDAYFSAE